MILTVDRKKKFLITMLIIMGCATMINYGLYNVLNSYFKNSDTESAYSTVQLNIIIVLTIIASVTVIMVILIPKENVNELMSHMEGAHRNMVGGSANGNLGLNNDNEEEHLTDEQQLQNMIDEDLEQDKKK